MAALFTQIIKGEIPCHKICENDEYLAFLDIRPVSPGHTLVIPKTEVDYIFDLDDSVLAGAFVFAKKVAELIRPVVDCNRIGIMVAGLEVPHAHIHLIPINAVADLNFSNAKHATPEELKQMTAKITGS